MAQQFVAAVRLVVQIMNAGNCRLQWQLPFAVLVVNCPAGFGVVGDLVECNADPRVEKAVSHDSFSVRLAHIAFQQATA